MREDSSEFSRGRKAGGILVGRVLAKHTQDSKFDLQPCKRWGSIHNPSYIANLGCTASYLILKVKKYILALENMSGGRVVGRNGIPQPTLCGHDELVLPLSPQCPGKRMGQHCTVRVAFSSDPKARGTHCCLGRPGLLMLGATQPLPPTNWARLAVLPHWP